MLIRKISNTSRWAKNRTDSYSRQNALFAGDAVADLRTSKDTLSVWYCPDDDKSKLDDIALAIASLSEKPSKTILVFLDENDLKLRGIDIKIEPAVNSPIKDDSIQNLHRDLVEIDYWHIGYLAEIIQRIVEDKDNYSNTIKEYTEKTIRTMLDNAYKSGRLDKTKLSERMRKSLGIV